MQDLKLIPNKFKQSASLFAKEKKKLQEVLRQYNPRIEHIGSTALPNSIGKGIIDILVICHSENDQEEIKAVLVTHGYRQGELEKEPDGRLFFCNTEGKTQAGDVHLHLVVKGSDNMETLHFRDYMLAHPNEIFAYNQEKKRLAKTHNYSRKDYVRDKAPFVQKIMSKIEETKERDRSNF